MTLIAGLLAMLVGAATANATTTATVSPNYGHPGVPVTVTGGGFDANAAIDVYWGTTEIGLATSKADGTVSTTVAVPTTAQPGIGWITLDEERSNAAAQASYNVYTNWVQGGYGPSGRDFNPFENTIGTGNVSQLAGAWAQPVTIYGNPKSLIDVSNDVYVADESDGIHAYSLTGKLQWTAKLGTAFSFAALTPASYGTLVIFADTNGVVSAYKTLCRTDGGVCATPTWTKNIGTAAVGGVTVRNGLVYVPGADGVIHVLNATTGAIGTSLTLPGSSTPGAALSSNVSFDDAGDYFVAQGVYMNYNKPTIGVAGNFSFPANTQLSDPAAGENTAYYTTSTGYVSSVFAGWANVALNDSTPCYSPPAPVVANGYVYAQGCGTLGEYDANTGAPQWTLSIGQGADGISYANGVLYACINDRLAAYYASYGEKLWSGGPCTTAPVVVNGEVLDTDAELYASTLSGAQTTAMRHGTPRPPDPRDLHPTIRRGQQRTHARGTASSRRHRTMR